MLTGQSCMKLHEIAVMNKIVETYEKITTEVAPGIHGVREKIFARMSMLQKVFII